jgi:hypothetical protein
MRTLTIAVLLLAAGPALTAPAWAQPRLAAHGGLQRRAVVVRPGWPLRRPLPRAIIRSGPVQVRVAPLSFLAPIVWASVVITSPPPPEAVIWQDRETLRRDDDWSELTLDCGQRGSRLDLEIEGGRIQIDWAEIVFANGQTQVVDFDTRALTPGLYTLLDLSHSRRIDHVRLLTRAMSREARVTLQMER